jgi:hypothetical protein
MTVIRYPASHTKNLTVPLSLDLKKRVFDLLYNSPAARDAKLAGRDCQEFCVWGLA